MSERGHHSRHVHRATKSFHHYPFASKHHLRLTFTSSPSITNYSEPSTEHLIRSSRSTPGHKLNEAANDLGATISGCTLRYKARSITRSCPPCRIHYAVGGSPSPRTVPGVLSTSVTLNTFFAGCYSDLRDKSLNITRTGFWSLIMLSVLVLDRHHALIRKKLLPLSHFAAIIDVSGTFITCKNKLVAAT